MKLSWHMTSGVAMGHLGIRLSKKSDMAVAIQEWLELIEREYLPDFVTAGGSGEVRRR